jgi:WD40 repeat protein
LRARLEASRQVISSIPRPVALAAAAILVVPAALGLLASSYLFGVQARLGVTLLDPDDPVTALWWSDSDDQHLVVGTQSGAMMTVSVDGTVRDTTRLGAAVVDIEPASDGSPLPVTLAADQVAAIPSGALARAAGYGPQTCRNRYVWREATADDLVCVFPEVRAQALADRAAAEAQGGTAVGCAEGLVPRRANDNDRACSTPDVAARTAEENRLDESRKLFPAAARVGTRRVALTLAGGSAVEGERGLIVVSGTSIIAGERTTTAATSDSLIKQSVDIPQPVDVIRLAQWSLADGAPVRTSEVGALEDVRVLAAQPATSQVYAGDGTGTIYAVDASAQMSGTNPEQYLRRLGSHGAPITELAVAAAPAEGLPSLASAAEDGSVEVWWPDLPAASRALVPPATSRSIMSHGTEWLLAAQVASSPVQLPVRTASGREAVVLASDGWVALLAAPSIDIASFVPQVGSLEPPFAVAPDGRLSIGYDPANGAFNIYQGALSRLERSRPGDASLPMAINPRRDEVALVDTDGVLSILGLSDGRELRLPLPTGARYLAYDPTGTQLAVGLDDTTVALVRPSDATLLEIVGPLPGIGGDAGYNVLARDVRYSPNGRQLVMLDPNNVAVARYGIRTRGMSDWHQFGPVEQLFDSRISEDGGRLVARRGTDELVIYDTQSGATLGLIASPGYGAWAMSPDASIVALVRADGGIDVYAEEGSPAAMAAPPRPAGGGLRLSADGSTLLIRDRDGQLHTWGISGPEEALPLLSNLAPDLIAVGAEIAPDGSSVVVADASGGVYLIELPGLRRIGLAGHGSIVHRMRLSADGKLLASASLDGIVQVTDLERARQIAAVPFVTMPIGRRPERLQPRMLAEAPVAIDPAVQEFLDTSGYGPVPVDGVLGIATRAAVARWQAANAWPQTGVPNEALLNQATPRPSAR